MNYRNPTNSAQPNRSNHTVAPVVIRQMLRCENSTIKILEKEAKIINVVARIRNLHTGNFKSIFGIQDVTGTMTAIQYHSGEDEREYDVLQVNTYVQIFGNIMATTNKKVLNVFKVLPVTDANQITFHYLQCIDNKLKSNRPRVDESSTQMTYASSVIEPTPPGLMTHRQKVVYDLILRLNVEDGLYKEAIDTALDGKLDSAEIQDILDWLCQEGFIYTTIDEVHYKATASFETCSYE